MTNRILHHVSEAQGIEVRVLPEAQEEMQLFCLADLSNGGRGIRNQLDSHFVNPLARALFDANLPTGSKIEITEVKKRAVTELGWRSL